MYEHWPTLSAIAYGWSGVNVDTSERAVNSWYARHVLNAAIVQSTIVRVWKWTGRNQICDVYKYTSVDW